MAKRELPIFVLDTNRAHKKGECDWIVCTDRDSGFVAKIDYVDGDIDEVGDDYRIQSRGVGISIRIAIVRSIGDNPKTTDVRTLLKKAAKHYIDTTVKPMNVNQPTRQECVESNYLSTPTFTTLMKLGAITTSERQCLPRCRCCKLLRTI